MHNAIDSWPAIRQDGGWARISSVHQIQTEMYSFISRLSGHMLCQTQPICGARMCVSSRQRKDLQLVESWVTNCSSVWVLAGRGMETSCGVSECVWKDSGGMESLPDHLRTENVIALAWTRITCSCGCYPTRSQMGLKMVSSVLRKKLLLKCQ